MGPKRDNHVSECIFHDGWLDPLHPEFDKSFVGWLTKLDSRNGQCGLCKKAIFLSNMGKRAIISHTNGRKHQQLVRATQIQPPVTPVRLAPDGAPPLPVSEQVVIELADPEEICLPGFSFCC